MRVLFGMILGAFLTVGVAFFYDTWATGPAVTTGSNSSVVVQRPMVNWDVIGENWRIVRLRVHDAWTTLSHKMAG